MYISIILHPRGYNPKVDLNMTLDPSSEIGLSATLSPINCSLELNIEEVGQDKMMYTRSRIHKVATTTTNALMRAPRVTTDLTSALVNAVAPFLGEEAGTGAAVAGVTPAAALDMDPPMEDIEDIEEIEDIADMEEIAEMADMEDMEEMFETTVPDAVPDAVATAWKPPAVPALADAVDETQAQTALADA